MVAPKQLGKAHPEKLLPRGRSATRQPAQTNRGSAEMRYLTLVRAGNQLNVAPSR
jgi:hypothetical protein